MKKNKLFLVLALMLAVTLFLAACGGGNDDNANGDKDNGANDTEENNGNSNDNGDANGDADADIDAPDFMSLLTGGTSGTYYPLGGEMATIITNETGIQTDALSSNASADNIIDLQEGTAELAFTQSDVAAFALDGINAFDGNPVDNVLGIGSLYPESVQIVTTADTGIESVEDLEGKNVSVGAPGSGTYINAEQILEAHGLTMDDINAQYLDFGESTGGIQDGNIDAAFITSGWPTGAVEGLGATTDVSIVPIADDKIAEIIEEYPYYLEDTIPGGTYGGIDEDVKTVAVGAILVASDSLSEDAVYAITKALYDNAGSITHSKGEFITPENGVQGVGIDLHPGAERYFEEAGVLE